MKEYDDLEDFEIEDLLKERKKKVDGGKKGKSRERDLVKLFVSRFGEGFSRSPGSGNRGGIPNLPAHARESYTGDLCCPVGFKFVIESKGGYNAIDLNSVFTRGNSELDKFMDQVSKDSLRSGRKPLLAWKKDRKPWLAFVHTKELAGKNFKYRLLYGKWSVVALDELLKLEDNFFFEERQGNSPAVREV